MFELLFFVVGILFLIKGADWVVDGGASFAKRFRVPQIVIGLTVVAFGTSLPELVVNVFAVFRDAPGVVFGNILGSNIANILLVIGLTAIVGSISVRTSTVWRQIPFAILASFILLLLSNKAIFGIQSEFLSTFDGFILLSLFGFFMYYVIQIALDERRDVKLAEVPDRQWWKMDLKLLFGIAGLYFGGKWVVSGALLIADQFGLSHFLVSATFIALGTSLPELAVCIVAVLKKNIDLAIGNVVGSNIFNILWVLGIIPMIKPLLVPSFIWFDLLVMLFATVLLFILMFIGKKHEITKKEGIVLFLIYVIYITVVLNRG